MPYYRVIKEYFSEKLGQFTDPQHKCECNHCCLDMESIKQKAIDEALAAVADANKEAAGDGGAAASNDLGEVEAGVIRTGGDEGGKAVVLR